MNAALRHHPWLSQVYLRDGCVLLVLNAAGVAALHSHGKAALVRALSLPCPVHAVRMLDETQAALSFDVDALLRAPLSRDPIVLAEESNEQGMTIRLHVPVDLAHFPGHFAGAPVVPGAVQVAWALSLAAPRLGTGAGCHTMEALKFQQLLRPGAPVTLTLRADHARGKLHFAYRHDEAIYSSGRLVWSDQP
ncbi:hypothetical protein [Dyella sp.]|uniref:ApeI family dehydratase n=1 Tax=Dyella sp. TaxID=1869338 RepID=UPI002ED13804